MKTIRGATLFILLLASFAQAQAPANGGPAGAPNNIGGSPMTSPGTSTVSPNTPAPAVTPTPPNPPHLGLPSNASGSSAFPGPSSPTTVYPGPTS